MWKISFKRLAWSVVGTCLLLVIVAMVATPLPSVVKGFVNGEPFYAGKPLRYWRTKLRAEAVVYPKEDPHVWLPSFLPRSLREESSDVLADGRSESVPVLIGLLNDEDRKTRMLAAHKLGAIGPEAESACVELFNHMLGDKDIRWPAAHALASLGKSARDRVPFLIETLHDDDSEIRAVSAYLLGRLEPDPLLAIPALQRALKDQNHDVRGYAGYSLYEVDPHDDELVESLILLLSDSEGFPRYQAARALAAIGGKAERAKRALLRACKDEDRTVRGMSVHALVRNGPPFPPELVGLLLEWLDGKDSSDRLKAINTLGELGTEADSAIPELTKALGDKDALIRSRADAALQRIRR